MQDLENNNGWTEWSKYVLKELEKLGENSSSLSEEINTLNGEVIKVSEMKHIIGDFKEWKTSIEETVNLNDLESIKKFYIDNKDMKLTINSIIAINKDQNKKIEELEKFKTKVYTVIGIAAFLVTTAIALIKAFL